MFIPWWLLVLAVFFIPGVLELVVAICVACFFLTMCVALIAVPLIAFVMVFVR